MTHEAAMQVVVMGVTGVGKSTVGIRLADAIGARFVDADDYHPEANVHKMRAGIPLDDDDRAPWLDALNQLMRDAAARGETVVLACSALKAAYRNKLARDIDDFRVIHLHGSEALIASRLASRRGHYMNPALLASQLATLEPPDEAIRLDIALAPDALADAARRALGAAQESTAVKP
jgi:gluconokinase